jgi:hypothetical protein
MVTLCEVAVNVTVPVCVPETQKAEASFPPGMAAESATAIPAKEIFTAIRDNPKVVYVPRIPLARTLGSRFFSALEERNGIGQVVNRLITHPALKHGRRIKRLIYYLFSPCGNSSLSSEAPHPEVNKSKKIRGRSI